MEERRGRGVGDDEDSNDRFPIGMRVLAVDDDPTCLKLLETLLRHCNYHGSISIFHLFMHHIFFPFFWGF